MKEIAKLIVDIFSGGGGASVGIEMSTGREVDIAINHDMDAILMHKTNHPHSQHLLEDIWDVSPLEVTKGRQVGLLWASPDCKHFSKAKGGKPKDKNIRSLPFAIVKWARHVRPDVIIAENVEEIQTWGPLNKKGIPIAKRKGETFNQFIRKLRKLGYSVQWRELIAADYGTPTTRKRWYMIARCDGKPIVWPVPTHSKTGENGLEKWVPVSTVLDFSDLGKSIFGRKKPLAENTMNRIGRGMDKFVFNNPEPFIMQIGQAGFTKERNKTIHEPLTTIVTKNEHCLVTPHMIPIGYGERKGQLPRTNSVEEPLGTIVSSGKHYLASPILIQYHSETSKDSVRAYEVKEPIMTIDASPRYALASCFLSKYYGGTYKGSGSGVDEPIHTITSKDHNALMGVFLTKFYKSGTGQEVTEPLHTITTSAGHFGDVRILMVEKEEVRSEFREKCNMVASFIIQYYSQGVGQSLDEPLHTIVTKDRFALVTIYGIDYVIVDITLRMLTPNELFKAQGFPNDYIIDMDYTGRAYPIAKQVARVGNSVCPQMAKVLVGANCSYLKTGERAPNMKIDTSQSQLRFA